MACLSCVTSKRATGRSRRCTASPSRSTKVSRRVLGANGAGKTTTLRAISGTVRRSGEITFAGKTIRRRAPRRWRTRESRTSRRAAGRSPSSPSSRTSVSARTRGATARRRHRGMAGDFPWILDRATSARAPSRAGSSRCSLLHVRYGPPRLLMLDEPSLGLAPLIVREIFRIVARAEREGRPDGPRRRTGRARSRSTRRRPHTCSRSARLRCRARAPS